MTSIAPPPPKKKNRGKKLENLVAFSSF